MGIKIGEGTESGNEFLACIIEQNIDLVSPYPLAFMTPAGTEPRHAVKSENILIFEEEGLKLYGISNLVFDGYPVANPDELVSFSVDGMKYIHNEVDRVYSLTIAIHAR